MDNKISEQISNATRKMVESMTTLQKINDRTMQDLAKQQMDAAEAFVDVGSKQLKGLGNVKTVQDAVTAQADITSEVGKMMIDRAKQTMEVLTRSQSELKTLMENNLNELMDQAKSK